MNITLILNPEEQSAINQIIDAALRHAGVGALEVAVHFKNKLGAAVAAAQEEATTSNVAQSGIK